MVADAVAPKATSPIFVVGVMNDAELFADTLAQAPDVWSADTDAADVVDLVPELHPSARGWSSGRLSVTDATPETAGALREHLRQRSRDRDDRPAPPNEPVRLLDRSPMHAIRVAFLAAAFPDAKFVYVHRQVSASLAGSLNGWLSQRAVAYPDLRGWTGPRWTGPLTPGWEELTGLPLTDVVARQWRVTAETLLADLENLPADRWAVLDHDRLVATPQPELVRICRFLGLDWDRTLTGPLTERVAVVDVVEADAVAAIVPMVADVAAVAADLIADDTESDDTESGDAEPGRNEMARSRTPAPAQFESRHSMSFPALLSSLGVSLLVSTYQSGRLILCRASGEHLNTHFRMLPVPMGIAVDGGRISVGTERRIITYRNHANAVGQLGDARYDACFLPLHAHVSGNIQVHELAYLAAELWAVSTRFSSLVTFDGEHSFVPRWRPPFVSALAAEDRCHLNGLAAVDGRAGYVTALGVTDTPNGWRDEKGSGGVLIDVASGDVVAGRLAMPHSPRWYDGRLWVLESGKGSLAVVDPATGQLDTVVELPGFTRGLTFVGPYAFVGLSQVRESVFRGLPIVQRQQRECGVWVVDIRDGAVAGHLQFTGAVQEIFDVQMLPYRWPELGELDGEMLNRSFVLPSTTVL
jgi:uncharacterized protein (TIGR03032 family)